MSDVKKPQDRKPKAAKDLSVSVDGVSVTVSPDALDDFELLDDLSGLQDGNAAKLPSILRRLAGDDYKRILDELRGDAGRVSVKRATEFIGDLIQEISPNS